MTLEITQRRFENLPQANPEGVTALGDDHPAILLEEPLFERSVVTVTPTTNIFVSGQNNRKIGRIVTKGHWRGKPIFTLTLPERKTCPSACAMWKTCYGNAMPFARRHEAGPALEQRIVAEVERLSERYPKGFVVRLHVLGDFYSVEYVKLWADMLRLHPPLNVFGYTGRAQGTDALSRRITAAIAKVKQEFGQRFSIRWSMTESIPDGTTVVDRIPEGANVREGLVCPAEREATACCATCGLCWEAPDKTIVFVRHGMGSDKRDRVIHEATRTDDRGLRQVKALPNLAEIAGPIKTRPPRVIWVKPSDLYVDEAYQRNLTRNSLSLITKVVTGFSWRNYKMPVVSRDKKSKTLRVHDGQHTAIGAASHPDLDKIPVMLVDSKTIADQAKSFIAHNRDRIAVTPTQMYYSNIVAGDPEALEVADLCERSNVNILRAVPPNGYGASDTTALGAIRTLLRTFGITKATAVLKVLSSAELAPIRSDQIKAVAKLLYDPSYEGSVTPAELRETLKVLEHDQINAKARDVAASTAQRHWEALAYVYYQQVQKNRRKSARRGANGHAEARA